MTDSLLFFALFIILGIIIIRYVLGLISQAFGYVGFTRNEAVLIIFGVIVGAFIDIPLFTYNNWVIAVNVGGALIPLYIALRVFYERRIPLQNVLIGIIAVTIPAYFVTRFEPGMGIIAEFPFWLIPPLVASLVSISSFQNRERCAAPLAYVAGTLGVLIGADALHFGEVLAYTPAGRAVASIGGGGIGDMVFLTGVIAVLLDALLIQRLRNEDPGALAAELAAGPGCSPADTDEKKSI